MDMESGTINAWFRGHVSVEINNNDFTICKLLPSPIEIMLNRPLFAVKNNGNVFCHFSLSWSEGKVNYWQQLQAKLHAVACQPWAELPAVCSGIEE